jgi:hypothetical protein
MREGGLKSDCGLGVREGGTEEGLRAKWGSFQNLILFYKYIWNLILIIITFTV